MTIPIRCETCPAIVELDLTRSDVLLLTALYAPGREGGLPPRVWATCADCFEPRDEVAP
jgi:hypothetical protein